MKCGLHGLITDCLCGSSPSRLEEDERLVLTPFEKNLEVWRQLWRVLERSDVIVQVCSCFQCCAF